MYTQVTRGAISYHIPSSLLSPNRLSKVLIPLESILLPLLLLKCWKESRVVNKQKSENNNTPDVPRPFAYLC